MRDKSGRFTKAPPPKMREMSEDIGEIFWMVSELKRDLKAMRGEIGERLRQVEGDICQIQKYMGVLSRPVEAQRYATCNKGTLGCIYGQTTHFVCMGVS